ncbi:MAG: hypothetical protein WA061_01375 [Microgenomates group bacterium]
MKLKQIEEIATRKVPVWQPGLLIVLLLMGYFIVPILAKNTQKPSEQNKSTGTTLGINTLKEDIKNKVVDSAQPYLKQVQKDAESVLGVAQQTVQNAVQDIASKSADSAKVFVFDNTLGKVLQNINTLPSDQQELIRKAICK